MLDSAIVVSYLTATVLIGIHYGRKIKNIEEFSIGKRNFSIPIIVATLVATLIGGGSTLGIAEQSFRIGLIFPLAYCGMALERFLVAYLVAPHMNEFFGSLSAGDIMGRLYGKNAQVLTGIATITTSVFMVGAHITAMGFVFEASMDMSRTHGLILGTIIVLSYAPFGGINSVTFTDVFQFLCILAAIPIACAIGLHEVGGINSIVANVPDAHLNIFLNEGKTLYDHSLIFLSYSIPACYPVIIQRILMSKNVNEAKRSLIVTGLLSAVFFLTVGILGLVVRVKAPHINPQQTFAFAINNMLPIGIKGLVVAGLIAVMMSTMDSFLNSIGIAASHDILLKLTNRQSIHLRAVNITRVVIFFSAIASLISAIYFNGVLESVFASMNLWIPFIFPPLIIGIREKIKSPRSFYLGMMSAAFVIFSFKILGLNGGLLQTAIASLANLLTVKLVNRKFAELPNKQRNDKAPVAIISSIKRILAEGFSALKSDTINTFRYAEIIASFSLMATILPILTSTGLMENPLTNRIYFQLLVSIWSVLLILKDLWIPKISSNASLLLWFASLCLFFCFQPAYNLLFESFSTLSLINFLIASIIIIAITNRNPFTLLVLTLSFTSSLLLYRAFPLNTDATPLLSQFIEASIRILTLTYFFIATKNLHLTQIRTLDNMSGTMAHEINHSIVSMRFCALRLRKSIPLLLQHYREHSRQISPDKAINEVDLKALSDLAARLEENASRTKNTIQIIQTKIKTGAIEGESAAISMRAAAQEALNSGFADILHTQTAIKIQGSDFSVMAEKGPIVHVFINLLKNAVEALSVIKDPKVLIELDAGAQTVKIIDNGPGISKEIISHIFDENFTTKKNGAGKGLHFCRLIIEEFDGTLSCQSVPGRTTFFIDFSANKIKDGP